MGIWQTWWKVERLMSISPSAGSILAASLNLTSGTNHPHVMCTHKPISVEGFNAPPVHTHTCNTIHIFRVGQSLLCFSRKVESHCRKNGNRCQKSHQMYVSLSKQSLEMCMQFRTERFKTQYTAAEAFNPRDFQIDKLKRKKLPSKKEQKVQCQRAH